MGFDMEQWDVETEQAERTKAHEAARMELQRLIDNPEKHLPVIDYLAHLQDAKRAVARTYKAMQAAGA